MPELWTNPNDGRGGYELVFRHFAYQLIHEDTHYIAIPSFGSWPQCKRATDVHFVNRFDDFMVNGWPRARVGGRSNHGIKWKRVYADDLFICPECAEFHQPINDDWNRFLPWHEADWKACEACIVSRLGAREFYYKRCFDRDRCAANRKVGFKALAIQKRLYGRRISSKASRVVQPKAEIEDDFPADPKVFVYLIEADCFYKIGVAVDVSRRLAGLQTSSPFKLKVLKAWECSSPFKAERNLHTRLKAFRCSGEWFRLPQDEVAALLQVNDLDVLFASPV